MDFFDAIFGNSKSVRRDVLLRTKQDAHGNPIVEPVEGESVSLSAEHSVDRLRVRPDRFYDCGCNAEAPMGGQCADPKCRKVSCARCFGRCAYCSKPICLEHSHYASDAAARLRLCARCHGQAVRRRIMRGVVRPFVRFDDETR